MRGGAHAGLGAPRENHLLLDEPGRASVGGHLAAPTTTLGRDVVEGPSLRPAVRPRSLEHDAGADPPRDESWTWLNGGQSQSGASEVAKRCPT